VRVAVRCLVPVPGRPSGDALLELPAGATVAAVIRALDLPAEAVAVACLNGAPAGPDTPLADGDRLSLIPPITGG